MNDFVGKNKTDPKTEERMGEGPAVLLVQRKRFGAGISPSPQRSAVWRQAIN